MNQPQEDKRQPSAPAEQRLDIAVLPTLDSQRLFDGRRELIIQHQGEIYRLRITRHDKLILTK